MISSSDDVPGIFVTRNGAYNFLRRKLQVPKGALVFKDFFDLLIVPRGSKFVLVKTEDEVDEIFSKYNIPKLTKDYYQALQSKDPEASKISGRIMNIVREEVAA